MNQDQLLNHLRELKLSGMASALEQQFVQPTFADLPFESRLGMLLTSEANFRDQRRQGRILKIAKLKVHAAPEEIEYRPTRNLDRQMMASLLTSDWIRRRQNVLIVGPSGSGKTWIGCCLGVQGARHGYTVLYKRTSRLLEEMETASTDGSLLKLRAQLARVDLLILDDFGLTPLTSRGKNDLLEVLDDRGGAGSTVVVGQMPVKHWHDFIAEPAVADAILERLVYSSHRIELKGESMRKARQAT